VQQDRVWNRFLETCGTSALTINREEVGSQLGIRARVHCLLAKGYPAPSVRTLLSWEELP